MYTNTRGEKLEDKRNQPQGACGSKYSCSTDCPTTACTSGTALARRGPDAIPGRAPQACKLVHATSYCLPSAIPAHVISKDVPGRCRAQQPELRSLSANHDRKSSSTRYSTPHMPTVIATEIGCPRPRPHARTPTAEQIERPHTWGEIFNHPAACRAISARETGCD